MSALDESASTIVELLTRLDMRLEALEAKVDSLLAARRAAPAEADMSITPMLDRRRSQVAFNGVDRRMGEI
ncbi:MAG: hypothetical protein IT548_19695 [Alphaproteobacteria bacterium]|nr:hypothetical protein [Alphaproteobacteria bacterium]